MKKLIIWIILFIIGFIMIIGAYDFSRWLSSEVAWYIVGTILSFVSGIGIMFDIYLKRE